MIIIKIEAGNSAFFIRNSAYFCFLMSETKLNIIRINDFK